MEAHMCVGPDCWICGEPSDIRFLRRAILEAFWDNREAQGLSQTQVHALSKLATQAIREELNKWHEALCEESSKVWQLQQQASNPDVCSACGVSLRECEACGA